MCPNVLSYCHHDPIKMKYSQVVKDLAMKMMKRLTSESTKGTPARRLQDPLARAEYYTDISKKNIQKKA